jgi:hypothetical protein
LSRERVERTLTVVEAVGEVVVWTQRRWIRCGIETHVKEWASGVDPAAVGEAIGEDPLTVEMVEHVNGGEMRNSNAGFTEQSCN